MIIRPAFQKGLEFRVGFVGQFDPQGDVLIAPGAVFPGRKAFSLEAQAGTAVGLFGDRHRDRTVNRGYANLRPQNCLMQCDRQLDMHVIALPSKQTVGLHMHRNQRVTARAATHARHSLALEPQNLTVPQAGRNRKIEAAPIGHGDTALGPLRGIHEVHLEGVSDITAAHPDVLPAPGTTPATVSEEIRKDVPAIAKIGITLGRVIGMVRARIGIMPVELLFGTLLSFGIDFALVKAHPLFRVAHDIVGRLRFLEAFFGIPVPGVQVWMMLLGELAIGLANFIRSRRRRHAESLVRIIGHGDTPKLHSSHVIWGANAEIEDLNPKWVESVPGQVADCGDAEMRFASIQKSILAGAVMLPLWAIHPAQANQCDSADFQHGVSGGKYCIAVETVTENPGAPLVVVLHGDMSSGKPPTYATRFAKRIADLSPDVTIVSMLRPGYDNGQGKKSEGSTNERRDHYTANNIDAVAKAVRNLAAHHKASHTIIVGHSGGAATAALIAGRNPDILDGMVLISCPCDITRWRLERNASSWPASLSPSDYVDTVPLDTIVLAMTGRNDDNTGPGLAKSYVAEIRERGGNATFIEIAGERHFLSTKMSDEILPRIAQMLKTLAASH